MFTFSSAASASFPFVNAALLEQWVRESHIGFQPERFTVSYGTDHPCVSMADQLGVCVAFHGEGGLFWGHVAELPSVAMDSEAWTYSDDGIHGGKNSIEFVVSRTGAVRLADKA